MRKLYYLIFIFLISTSIISCQNEETVNSTGYLRLEIGTNSYTKPQTRIADSYNPKQIAVQILDAKRNIVEETDDWETWSGKQLRLKPGIYTIQASSNGFDGSESGFDIPYYSGEEQITIESGKEKTVNITCTLANVKVTVNFDPTFIDAFRSASSTITSKLTNVGSLNFIMGKANKSAYFPVGNLSATINVTNKSGKQFSQTNEINNVKARDHYILNYKIAESGSVGGVDVTVDDTETIYTFTFNVSTEATTRLEVQPANAWSSFAYLEGTVGSSKGDLDETHIFFEYKLSTTETWISESATQEEKKFKTTLTGLTPNTKYDYRLVYKKDNDTYSSDIASFTTEAVTELYNGNFDNWYKSGSTWYADTKEGVEKGSFWDSSNGGTGSFGINPTTGNSGTIHTAGGQSAQLVSQYVVVKFAAASLYTGSFAGLVSTKGAKINFGQPFTSRPTQLHGFFQYAPGTIQYVGSNTPASAGIVKDQSTDICSIYIALSTQTYLVDNTNTSTFIDFENDPGIVAYGELPLSECGSTNGEWKEFNIELKYHSITTKPTHIIIVCSSSKYGDYFTGSKNSIMYLDDFELRYGTTPTIK